MTGYEIKFPKQKNEDGFLNFVIHPNYITQVDRYTSNSFREEVKDTAARLYFITNLLPNLKGRDLMLIAEGDYSLVIDEVSDADFYIATLTTGGEDE